jgi:Spy/CpxP family protein refolding chaperone
MKLNKTLMIAALVAGSVLAADYTVRAQDSTNTPPAGARPPSAPGARGGRMNFDSIAKQLNLTDDQKEKAKPIFQDMTQKFADLRQDSTLSPADRRAKMKEIRDGVDSKFKEIFTPEQYDKWTKMTQGNRRPTTTPNTPPPAGGNQPQQ